MESNVKLLQIYLCRFIKLIPQTDNVIYIGIYKYKYLERASKINKNISKPSRDNLNMDMFKLYIFLCEKNGNSEYISKVYQKLFNIIL